MSTPLVTQGALRTALLFAALAVPPGPLDGQDASLAALLAEADSANPEISAARKAAEAAAARVPQAGALPDPTVAVGFMNVPVTAPGLAGDMMTMTQVQVGARLPWPGKLSLHEAAAGLEARAASLDVERARQGVRADVRAAYYEIYFLDRAIEITRRNERLLAGFAELTSTRYAVGAGTQPDVLKAQVERSGLADQLVTLRARREGEVARLNALLRRVQASPLPATEIPQPVRLAALVGGGGTGRFTSAALSAVMPGAPDSGGPLPTLDDLLRIAREHNPAILADERRVEAGERRLALAERAKLPDLSISGGYSRRAGFGDFFNITLSAPVPVFAGRKQDQGVVERTAALAALDARHRALVDGLGAEIAALAASLRRAREQILLLDEGILPQAEAALASSTASYRVGRVDFLTLLDAQVTLYRHQLDYHRLLADFAKDISALERAVGTEVLR